MRTLLRIGIMIGLVVGIAAIMIAILGFHLGGPAVLRVGLYSRLTGAFIGGMLVLVSVIIPARLGGAAEPWLKRERFAWILLGLGCIMWGIGEGFWRYYLSIGQHPFPSRADIGYASLPPLVLLGLLLQPSSGSGPRRLLLLLDSLIAMGSMLAIAWYLLLGTLVLASMEHPLTKFLGLYYPTSDILLLTCVVLLLLRGQGRVYQATARRVGLLVVGLGLCFFVTSDFIFNVQQNAGTYVDGTWVDLGWPLGLMTIGLAAYLRRFLPATSADLIEQRERRRRITIGLGRLVPYLLLAVLFVILALNVLLPGNGQMATRPVLLFATMGVVDLVVIRQILTMLDNERLTRRQADALERLEMANQHAEEQELRNAERNAELEVSMMHLKDVQSQLSNGNLRARANLAKGELLPLSTSLNLVADHMMRLGQAETYLQRLAVALADLSVAFDRYRAGGPLIIPPSCTNFPEINRLLLAMGMKKAQASRQFQPGGFAPKSLAPSQSTALPSPSQPSQASQSLSQSLPSTDLPVTETFNHDR